MVKLFKRQKRFVEINFAPKKRWELIVFLSSIYPKLKSRNFLVLLISILSFTSIFVEKSLAEKIIEKQKEKILTLQRKLRFQNLEIQNLRNQLKQAEQKFKNFYIPHLKEKIFYIWYYRYGRQKIWTVINKFYKIVKDHTSLVGFRVFPSPYNDVSENLIFLPVKEHKVIYKPIKGNPFLKNKNIYNSFVIYVKPFELDLVFRKNLQKIKDDTIKANLILEYGLLTKKIKPNYIKIPITIEFPLYIPLVNTTVKDMDKILTNLKSFCNTLWIDSIFKEKRFSLNGKKFNTIISGICIKNIY